MDPDASEEARREQLRAYLEHGVRVFVDLSGTDPSYESLLEEEATKMGIDGVAYHGRPIKSVPATEDMKEILNVVEEGVNKDKTTYVHCNGGVGRTGTVVGCYLARNGTTNAAEEVNRLFQSAAQSAKGKAPEKQKQIDFVNSWEE